ncbi:hypothetical protein B7494_g6463 [Chlorociboria aeruginascens]|nr:hypothetical protein B7494_g6463 [Chlorociboria aeruginascens]
MPHNLITEEAEEIQPQKEENTKLKEQVPDPRGSVEQLSLDFAFRPIAVTPHSQTPLPPRRTWIIHPPIPLPTNRTSKEKHGFYPFQIPPYLPTTYHLPT